MQFPLKKIFFLLLLVIILPAPACKKSTLNANFPSVSVSKFVYMNLPPYNYLQIVGNYMYIDDAGYKGLIVYHRSIDEWVAFDRGCTYDPTNVDALLSVVTGGLTVKDSHCGSEYNLIDGSVISNPATTPMKQYRVDYDQAGQKLYIYN
jgi:nitrite reductase/ring-hydroxylating ferredoxin subunit